MRLRHRYYVRLNKTQLIVLSEISRDIAQVFFGSIVVVPFALGGIDKINWINLLLGGILTILFWISSIVIAKK